MSQVLIDALHKRDTQVARCPLVTDRRTPAPSICPRCRASRSEPCGLTVLADSEFVETMRANLNNPITLNGGEHDRRVAGPPVSLSEPEKMESLNSTLARLMKAGRKAAAKTPRQPKPYRGKFLSDIPQWIEWYESGMSILQVAERAGTNAPQVSYALKRSGYKVRGPGNRSHEDPARVAARRAKLDARVGEIMEMRERGMSGPEIGVVLRITRERVRQLVAKAGRTEEFENRPLTPEQLLILREYEDGLDMRSLATKLEVGEGTTRKWLERAGIPIRPLRRRRDQEGLTKERTEQVVCLYERGLTSKEIARRLDLPSPSAVYRYLGYAAHPRKRKPGCGLTSHPEARAEKTPA